MTPEPDILAGLNDRQREAAHYASGPFVVLAGPGTGKTRVIVARIVRLLRDGAEPESVLAVTFTVKAAEEMRARIAEHIPARTAERLAMHTFHAFGRRVLDRFGDMLGLPSRRTIMDSAQQKRFLRSIVRDRRFFPGLDALGPEAMIEPARRFIEACRHSARTPADAAAYADAWAARLQADSPGLSPDERTGEAARLERFREMARLFAAYDEAVMRRGTITFDDFITLPVRLLDEKPAAAAILRSEIRHVLVDEFQDVNRAQIELLRRIAPARDSAGRPADLCVVGDDDQAIYGFRGSDSRAFEQFDAHWPEREIIPLTENYRSARPVLAAAGAIISGCERRVAPDKVIRAAGRNADHPGGAVEGVIVENDRHTGSVVAAMIETDRAVNPGRPWSFYAVIAHNWKDVTAAAEALRLRGIPVTSRRRPSPLDDASVQDLLAWIDLLTAPPGGSEPPTAPVQRLLIRPPFFVPAPDVMSWMLAFRRERSMEGEPGAPDLVQWLRERTSDPAVGRFADLVASLRHESATRRADEMADRIVREAGLAHAEDLDPRERAGRIAALVRVLRFARSRQPFLDPPGHLSQFSAYYNDLDEKEQAFEPVDEGRLDQLDDDDDQPDAVQAITAHGSKGLEFDTVFLLKCRPGGFPAKNESRDDERAPAAFLDVERDAQADEERRLFYVACTRSERRLVLIAKKKKARGKAVDYYTELTEDTPGLEVAQSDGVRWLERAGIEAPDGLDDDDDDEAATDAERRRRIVESAMIAARSRAYAALHDAAAPDLSAEALDRIRSRLADAAGALHALAHLRAHARLPARLPPEHEAWLLETAERFAHGAPPRPLTAPMKPPLSLSYSKIQDYESCPRCFYVKYVLGLDEVKTTGLAVGGIVHLALERFFNAMRVAESDGRAPPTLEWFAAAAREVTRREWPASEPFDDAVLRQVIAQCRAALEMHEPETEVLEIERVIAFPWPDPDGGPAHRFVAKIDRVDRMPDGGFRIVDYKTGEAWKKLTEPKPDDLQLCLYALALSAMLKGEDDASTPFDVEGVAEYWALGEGVRGRIAFKDLKIDKARKKVDEAIRGMLRGDFARGKSCKNLCALLPEEG